MDCTLAARFGRIRLPARRGISLAAVTHRPTHRLRRRDRRGRDPAHGRARLIGMPLIGIECEPRGEVDQTEFLLD